VKDELETDEKEDQTPEDLEGSELSLQDTAEHDIAKNSEAQENCRRDQPAANDHPGELPPAAQHGDTDDMRQAPVPQGPLFPVNIGRPSLPHHLYLNPAIPACCVLSPEKLPS